MSECRTTCPYCGVGCGVIVTAGDGGVSVRGDPDHPANFGRLCSKGAALAETLVGDERLLHPMRGGVRVGWDEALNEIAETFNRVIADHGPDAVGFYVSGQILTEDYYVANKLMKGFIGSANIDTNSRLCMASSVAGHKRAFGSDTVPGQYEDLELADLVILTGSNLAWCHPVLYQRLASAKKMRPAMRVVVVDPRRTATCDLADLHLMLEPGSDVALFSGLLNYLERNSARDGDYVERHTHHADDAIKAAREYPLSRVALETGLSHGDLETFFGWVVETDRTVTVYSQGVNQAADGTDKVNAIINTHLLTGRIGKSGAGPFSITGQPNAMGGREVGGLANQLASHMDLANPVHRDLVQRFWQSPKIASQPGLKAVDLFDAVECGRIKALWIMATNPVVSMPDADRVRAALRKCDLVVVSDMTANTDTARCADIVLPSTSWGEKDGTVTNSERRISRQRKFLPPPGDARHDWWQMCEVAKRMGFAQAFSYSGPHAIFTEYAALCGYENDSTRDLDLGPLGEISAAEYELLEPRLWPLDAEGKSKERLFSDGGFFTADRKARFVVPAPQKPCSKDGFILNTGRVRDHWHTMTRTGLASRLGQHIAEPFVEIAPGDAKRLGFADADLAVLQSERGSMIARVLITNRQQPGALFVPMHWTDAYAAKGRVDALVAPVTDPHSGQPALKSSRVRARKFEAAWYGFAAFESAEWDFAPECAYWAKARTANGWRIEMAGDRPIVDMEAFITGMVGRDGLAWVSVTQGGNLRHALYDGDRLVGLFFFGSEPVSASRSYLCSLPGTKPEDRLGVLAGQPGEGVADKGPIVCSCMNVGANEIMAAVAAGAMDADAIGAATQAGTNCGSCRSEFLRLLEGERLAAE